MIKDIGSSKECTFYVALYIIVTTINSFIPAAALWYSGQILKIVENAMESRTVDRNLLFRVAASRTVCSILQRLSEHWRYSLSTIAQRRIKAHYQVHILESYARLDLPTFEDPVIQSQLSAAWGERAPVAWNAVQTVVTTAAMALRLVLQLSVLAAVLKGQRDGLILAFLTFLSPLMDWMKFRSYIHPSSVWAATCRNDDYIRMEGVKDVVLQSDHRKEMVAGNMWEHLISEYDAARKRLGDAAGSFHEMLALHKERTTLSLSSFLAEPIQEMPQIVFALRAVQYPASIPVSLASLNLIQSTVQEFAFQALHVFDKMFGSIGEAFHAVRKLYDIQNITNRVIDGPNSFPEDQQKVALGVSVEFRNVSFKYPGKDDYALQGVSFKIERGQLCLILGENGSGKSTMLKLITRLYDPSEGNILIDDRDIRTIKLADLRRATSVLFQDYTHFPLSIKENIGLGDPTNPRDQDMIEQSAKLGGAYDFVSRLPEGFDTYLDRPVQDVYSSLPEGTTTLFGRKVDYGAVRKFGGTSKNSKTQLSGGQMQRLALSRTFMRSLGPDNQVGLLLFDEPSASLDPVAEHDLFERLRELRGNKTMIFSSHRFGNLTRNADIIICVKDSHVQEMGTHEQLMKNNEGYAKIYSLQAKAFLP
ncbi:P-loop containing nucleoside triphosphate hydrolase protein [Rickenella mellea]|uniref:P-loop containing nucleoside triphosphate hydrolase protein n=1 Tax=Rickenella mellea TaxID=50990 RepID=A0A4Y7QPC2_9AGAM|nr:P-loop containing nucleoside triphosphate hydrolase protein [Rickenella mellea]